MQRKVSQLSSDRSKTAFPFWSVTSSQLCQPSLSRILSSSWYRIIISTSTPCSILVLLFLQLTQPRHCTSLSTYMHHGQNTAAASQSAQNLLVSRFVVQIAPVSRLSFCKVKPVLPRPIVQCPARPSTNPRNRLVGKQSLISEHRKEMAKRHDKR